MRKLLLIYLLGGFWGEGKLFLHKNSKEKFTKTDIGNYIIYFLKIFLDVDHF